MELSRTPLDKKSTTDEIRERFDNDVERFSSLETGQQTAIDAPLAMDLITMAAVTTSSPISRVLDVGCGAGNNSIKLRQETACDFDVDLLDISRPMLDRAIHRVAESNAGNIRAIQSDLRTAELEDRSYNVIIAAAVLHHLRDDDDWHEVFSKLYRLLVPGGSLWITDLVIHETDAVHSMMWNRYGEYLESLDGPEYRGRVFAYIDREDSPRPVTYQLDLLREVGFSKVEILHKNSCFAAFGAVKGCD